MSSGVPSSDSTRTPQDTTHVEVSKPQNVPLSERAYRTPDWEIRREIRLGYFRTYAHGYWRKPFVVSVLGRVLIGKRGIRKSHERAGWL